MRNNFYNEIDNLSSAIHKNNKRMVNASIEQNRSNSNIEISRIRNDWMSFGATQIQNILNNDYFLFGTGYGSTVGE